MTDRNALYRAGLMKLALYQRPTPGEAAELRRRRLADGTYPVPMKADATRRMGFRLADPRTPMPVTTTREIA